jgi:transcriptional regulator with XRE-family HTH domain
MTDTGETQPLPNSREMAIRQAGGKRNPVAQRLRLLRAAIFHENSTKFAARVGISIQRMNNFENGYPVPVEVANRIRAAAPGVTLDWLYHGDERALPVEMLNKLRSELGKHSGNA